MRITLLGGGSWGSALAAHLGKRHSVKIWEFVAAQAREMQETRCCPLLPEVILPAKVFVTSDLKEALTNAELVLLVVPSQHVEATMLKAKPFLNSVPMIICSKGFAADGRLLSEVVQEHHQGALYCLYGPTHAEEVGQGLFSGIVLAGKGAAKLKPELESSQLKIEVSDDLIGVQVAAAFKNIVAIFIGVLDGVGLGDNAKAYVMTKGLAEITAVGLALGGKRETFTGLAGIGDLIVTCTSAHSRNRSVGQEVGKGRKLEEVLAEMKMVAEGITALQYVFKLQEKKGLRLPLITGLHAILYKGKNPLEILRSL